MIELLRDLARGFTAHHSALEVHGADASAGRIITAIRAHGEDYPKLVGSRGKHHNAMQTILHAIGEKLGKDIDYTLMPAERVPKVPDEFRPASDWKSKKMRTLLERVLAMAFGVRAFSIKIRTEGQKAVFVVTTDQPELATRLDFHLAVHTIFHAIGKTEGMLVHVEFKRA